MLGKYILLDVHGVLTDGNERKRFLDQMQEKYGMDYEQHNSLWVSHIDNLDKGLEKARDYLKLVNQTFKTNISIKEYYEKFLEEIHVNAELLKELESTGCKVFIVSDNVPDISTGLDKIFGSYFSKLKKFYSFQLGMTKRDGMLQAVLKNLSVKPNECLFIDDSTKNIEVAREIGINAVLFKSNIEVLEKIKEIVQ